MPRIISFFRAALFEVYAQASTSVGTKAIVSKVLVCRVLAIAIDNRTGCKAYHPTMSVRTVIGNSVTGKYPLHTRYTAKDPSTLGHHIFCFGCIELFSIEKYYVFDREPRATAREH
jgi:hypothetical protein